MRDRIAGAPACPKTRSAASSHLSGRAEPLRGRYLPAEAASQPAVAIPKPAVAMPKRERAQSERTTRKVAQARGRASRAGADGAMVGALVVNGGENIDDLIPDLDQWDIANVWAPSQGLSDVPASHGL